MIQEGLAAFKGKRVLLLQGPMGPFFRRLAKDMEWVGARVVKIDFNGGDWLFSPPGSIPFTGKAKDWPDFFKRVLEQKNIDVILLFGDCRPLHRVAHQIAAEKGLDIGIFEEGYIRPDYITLERLGVNGYSQIPRVPSFYLKTQTKAVLPNSPVGYTFWYAAGWSMLYYLASALLWPVFRHYKHHRTLSLLEALPWIRALWRKGLYKVLERGTLEKLSTSLSGKYFLAPLQVHSDSQIHVHSDYESMYGYINTLMDSFSRHASDDALLVIKHHPLDRGYHDYCNYISKLASKLGIEQRVQYIHDQSLPALLDHARGVVVVNSTVGLSAVHHGKPVKVCGSSIYDMEGLTYQGTLDTFWSQCDMQKPNLLLYECFRNYLIEHTQLNGNFYKRLLIPGSNTGLIWECKLGM